MVRMIGIRKRSEIAAVSTVAIVRLTALKTFFLFPRLSGTYFRFGLLFNLSDRNCFIFLSARSTVKVFAEMLLRLKESNNDDNHNNTHKYRARAEHLIVKALEFIVHKVLQHIDAGVRIIRCQKVYLSEYLERVYQRHYGDKDYRTYKISELNHKEDFYSSRAFKPCNLDYILGYAG